RQRRPLHLVAVATGIRAFAAVAAATQTLRREQAQPAVGITERSVNEDFGLDAGGAGDVAHFLEGQLAREHGARETELAQYLRAGRERLEAEVDGVGAVMKSGEGGVRAARRRQ